MVGGPQNVWFIIASSMNIWICWGYPYRKAPYGSLAVKRGWRIPIHSDDPSEKQIRWVLGERLNGRVWWPQGMHSSVWILDVPAALPGMILLWLMPLNSAGHSAFGTLRSLRVCGMNTKSSNGFLLGLSCYISTCPEGIKIVCVMARRWIIYHEMPKLGKVRQSIDMFLIEPL